MKKQIKKNKVLSAILVMSLLGASISGCGTKRASIPSENMAAATTAAAAITEAAIAMDEAGGMEELSPLQRTSQPKMDVDFNAEEYKNIVENGFKSVAQYPLSTFSADVDTAAYSNVRRMIESGDQIPEDAVRIEEMINYFRYDYPEPGGDAPLSVTTELSACPWNPDSQLLLIGVKAEEIDFENRPLSNFVFLLDVSGSMYSADKLPLVQKSFCMLTEELTERDRVSIVTYAGEDRVVLQGARGDEKLKITNALMSLEAGGSTAGSAGIQTAYELAEKNFIPGGNNRVILATDGDLNVGVTSESELERLISKKRETGVHLSVLGVGTGNIKDNKMVALANNGNGNYRYLDTLMEAKKVLVEEMGGTLITVAKDVKFQVEFNPEAVSGYRLIGYEKRELQDEDFANDTVDAGEIGSGHNVTVLYELLPVGSGQELSESQLKYQTKRESAGNQEELLTVNIRYKAPNGTDSKLVTYPVTAATYQNAMPDNMRFAAAVAEFGMILKESQWKGTSTYASVMDLVSGDVISDEYREEFVELVKLAKSQY